MSATNPDACVVCRKDVDGDLMMLCDGCDKPWHAYCVTGCLCCKKKPNLFGKTATVPDGDFFCKMCKGRVPHDEKKDVYTLAYSFGLNEAGQLGLGDEGKSNNRAVPTLIEDLKGVGLQNVTMGGWNTMILAHNGSVYTCGDGTSGKTGNADVVHEYMPRFRLVEKLEPELRAMSDGDIIHIVSGNCYSMAVVENGSIYTWGQGENGTLGHQAFTDKKTPSKISALLELEFCVGATIACGHSHTLAVTTEAGIVGDEILMSWGMGKMGQLGRGDLADKWVPQLLNPDYTYDLGESYYTKPTEEWTMPSIKKVAAGKGHSLVLTRNGQVWSWGSACMGQLGHGKTETGGEGFFSRNYVNVNTPKQIAALSGKTCINVFCGADHCFALTDDNEVYAWGRNSMGQCGTETGPSNVWEPTKVPGLSPSVLGGARVVNIACGDNHSIAVTDTNKIYVFGSGSSGQLGTGKKESLEKPTLLDFTPSEDGVQLLGRVFVYAGGDHSMIVYPTTTTPPKVNRKRKPAKKEEPSDKVKGKGKKGSAKKPAAKKAKTVAKKPAAKKSKKK